MYSAPQGAPVEGPSRGWARGAAVRGGGGGVTGRPSNGAEDV